MGIGIQQGVFHLWHNRIRLGTGYCAGLFWFAAKPSLHVVARAYVILVYGNSSVCNIQLHEDMSIHRVCHHHHHHHHLPSPPPTTTINTS